MTQYGALRTADRSARELLQVMDREVEIARKMLALANAQSDALAAHDIARLMATADQVRSLTTRQEELERVRLAVASAFAPEGGDPAPTAVEIAAVLPAPERARLLAARSELLDIQRALDTVTARNRKLLENAQDVTRASLDLLVRIATAPPAYGSSPGAIRTPTLYLDQRA